MSSHTTQNISYLKRLQAYKKIGYPIISLLDKTRLLPFVVPIINFTLKKAGIKKRFQKDLNYRLFSAAFKNAFQKEQPAGTKTIVIPFMSGGNNIFLLLNSLIVCHLQKKGYHAIFLVCDKYLPLCNNERIGKTKEDDGTICSNCYDPYRVINRETKADTRTLSTYGDSTLLSKEESIIDKFQTLEDCRAYKFNNHEVGKFTEKSVLRFFYTGSLEESTEHLRVYKKFLASNVRYAIAWTNFIKSLDHKPELVLIYNGTLSFESFIRSHCAERAIDYVTSETYVGTNSWIYKKNNEVMLLNWDEYWGEYIAQEFTTEKRTAAKNFIEGLKGGKEMYAKLNEEWELDPTLKGEEFVALFTNLNFDTSVLGRNPVFESMNDWIYHVIQYWRKNNIQKKLVIRVHPAELKLVSASQDFIGGKIKEWIGDAKNIVLYDAADKVNSYALIEHMSFGLIYGSTIGMEIAYYGKPCLIGGDAFYKGQNFVMRPLNKAEYFSALDDCLAKNFNLNYTQDDVLKFIYFIYFNRVKRLNGIDMDHARHINTFTFKNAEDLLAKNAALLAEFEREIIG